jgi:hypothetical protein
MIAACAYAAITGKKVAGLYDHTAAIHLQIAAEARDGRLQGADGDRSVRFGGTLPEIFDAGDNIFVSLQVEGSKARAYDRGSQEHCAVEVAGTVVNVYDYAAAAWFAFEPQFTG